MFAKLFFRRILPTLLALALLVLGGLWLYGYAGVKYGWIDLLKYRSLNAITRHGADTAGGAAELMKVKAGKALGI
ncbi:MAG: hypothetical protein J6V72_12150 [Kiritimatiellae bacterium]|nr:hypothetical protein [Kiritimatiellia bacterium]